MASDYDEAGMIRDVAALAAEKAMRIAEETIRTAQACQAIVATGATGADLAAALVEVAVHGEGRAKAIMAEPPPEAGTLVTAEDARKLAACGVVVGPRYFSAREKAHGTRFYVVLAPEDR